MKTIIPFLVMLIMFSACQKKKSDEPDAKRMDNYVPPASESEIDTTQGYHSPSDIFSDRSLFSADDFQPVQIKFRGMRNISYHVSQSEKTPVTLAVEYLHGSQNTADTVSTVSRILLYANNELVYRKAFPVEFSSAVNFSSVRKFDHAVLAVNRSKAIVYYWFDITSAAGLPEKEYHAVSVDQEGITNELSGDLVRIGGNYASVRFLNENRLKARIPPNHRYPDVTIDCIFSIDWKACTAVLDVPVDTVFIVSDQPKRFFNSRMKLHRAPEQTAPFRETNFRRLTQAPMQRLFAPSFFDTAAIRRDHLFIEFNKTVSGWIDYETMVFEEIISEQ